MELGKVSLDHFAFVPGADDKIVDTKAAIPLHDVPENGARANLNHGFGLGSAFLADPGAKTTRQNNGFHSLLFRTSTGKILARGDTGELMRRGYSQIGAVPYHPSGCAGHYRALRDVPGNHCS